MNKTTTIRLPELTLNQIEDIRNYYMEPEILGDRFSTSRITIIAINHFWNHLFNNSTD